VTDQRAILYRKTAELLRQDGWTQGISINAAGNRCLTQAVHDSGTELECLQALAYPVELFEPLMKTLREQWKWEGCPIIWNDSPGRTAEEVIILLEQTAEKLEADETITEGMS
jgi:hypothetical protein